MSESSQTLAEAISDIERRATTKETADNLDQKVQLADSALSSLNKDIEDLTDAVEELQFYREILDGAFDITPPGDAVIGEAETAVGKEKEEVVSLLVDSGLNTRSVSDGSQFEEYRKNVDEATKSVDSAIESAKEQLRNKRNKWEKQLKSAEELQSIIGSDGDEFARTVQWIRSLLNQKMFDPTNTASTVVSNWKNARKKWETNEELHGTDAFQRQHGLSDETMDAIKRLNNRTALTLDDLQIDTLEELKSVPELSAAVKLSI